MRYFEKQSSFYYSVMERKNPETNKLERKIVTGNTSKDFAKVLSYAMRNKYKSIKDKKGVGGIVHYSGKENWQDAIKNRKIETI